MRKAVRVRVIPTQSRRAWEKIRARLAGRSNAQESLELLNRCESSRVLRQCLPYISLGRIGLGLPGSTYQQPLFADDSPCLYFHEGHYTVSSYDNRTQWRFATAAKAIAFAEQYPTTIPSL